MHININIDVFEGPMDLLCYLINKNKINIYDIPILQITEQYMEYIEIHNINMEAISEFLVMAATLLEIKSKMLLPKKKLDAEEAPLEELVRRLVEYKKFQQMVSVFKTKELEFKKNIYKKPDLIIETYKVKEEINVDKLLEGITLIDLKKIYEEVISRRSNLISDSKNKLQKIKIEDYKVSDKIKYIRNLLEKKRKILFSQLVFDKKENIEKIVSFLAVLELIKANEVIAYQKNLFEDISINKIVKR